MIRKIALAVFGTLLAFTFLEMGLRVYYWAGENRVFGTTPSRTTIKWRDDNLVGRRLVPNQKGWFVTDSKEYYTWIEVNSEGWRDSEHTIVKPEDIYRILVIGDSFVENFQVPLEKTFFKQLEEKMNGQIESGRVEVIAMGLGDSGTAQQYLVLKEYGLRYNPDLVVHMFFTGNDVKNNSPTLMGDPHRPYFKLVEGKLQLQPFIPDRTSSLKKNSRLVELLLDKKGKILARLTQPEDYPVDYHVYDEEYSPEYQEAWEVTKTLIKQTKELVEEGGAEYILVTVPPNEQVNSDVWLEIKETYPVLARAKIDLEKPNKILKEFCEEHEINCLFMLSYFKEFRANNPQLTTHYRSDGHWTEEGTNFVAEFLIENLAKEDGQN